MSTRNLSRTAIEGGRAKHCRHAEKEQDDAERRRYRRYCQLAMKDPYCDEPRNNRCGSWDLGRANRQFKDRLRPVRGWLEKQVGRSWDKVYSEATKRWDYRTVKGRHILNHIKEYVINPLDVSYLRYPRRTLFPGELYIDSDRTLRMQPKTPRRNYLP